MTQIFVHPDATVVRLYQSVVSEAGISCFVRDDAGVDPLEPLHMPTHSPSLCVYNDADAVRAVEIIREYQRGIAENADEKAPDWICPNCGAAVPATFASCWKCEAARPAAE